MKNGQADIIHAPENCDNDVNIFVATTITVIKAQATEPPRKQKYEIKVKQ